MNIVVLVKQVPDTYSERRLSEADHTLDRESADAVLDEINERAVEEALQLKEAHGGEVTAVCMGPDRATDAIRKALSMGADKAVHLNDAALHGTDAPATARVLTKAIGTVEGANLVVAGNEASDGRAGAVPAMVAELLGWPQLTFARAVESDGASVSIERETDEGITSARADLPAVVSVTEKINEPRYPSFKGIMAAKKKPVSTLSLVDVGVEPAEVGLSGASSTVLESSPKPPKEAGEKVTDEGEGGVRVVEFLSGQKLV